MGYLTSFSLRVGKYDPRNQMFMTFADEFTNELLEELEKMGVFDSAYGGTATAYTKWYDADEDMILLSKRFPDDVFVLEGAGEDSDDRWLHYYKNGAMQDAGMRLIYDSFDESRLAPYPAAAQKTKYSYES